MIFHQISRIVDCVEGRMLRWSTTETVSKGELVLVSINRFPFGGGNALAPCNCCTSFDKCYLSNPSTEAAKVPTIRRSVRTVKFCISSKAINRLMHVRKTLNDFAIFIPIFRNTTVPGSSGVHVCVCMRLTIPSLFWKRRRNHWCDYKTEYTDHSPQRKTIFSYI